MSWSGTDYFLRSLNVLGWVFVYAALFLHKDEEGRIQNSVEEWWMGLRNKQNAARSWAPTFMREVARLTGQGFDLLFGRRLLSLRVVGVSFCLSIASFFLFGLLASALIHSPPVHLARNAFLYFLLFGALALTPAFLENDRLLRLLWWITVVVVLLTIGKIGFAVYAIRGGMATLLFVTYLLLVFGISFACDISFIALTRWILRRVSRIDHVHEILMTILCNLLILLILLVVPILIGARVLHYWPGAGLAIAASFALNSIDFVVGFAALTLALLLLLHRLVWTMVERPLYAIQRFAPIKNKRLLWRTGIALVVLPTHTGLGLLRSLWEKL